MSKRNDNVQAVVLYHGENPYMGRVIPEERMIPVERMRMICWCNLIPDIKKPNHFWLVPNHLRKSKEEEWKARGVIRVHKDLIAVDNLPSNIANEIEKWSEEYLKNMDANTSANHTHYRIRKIIILGAGASYDHGNPLYSETRVPITVNLFEDPSIYLFPFAQQAGHGIAYLGDVEGYFEEQWQLITKTYHPNALMELIDSRLYLWQLMVRYSRQLRNKHRNYAILAKLINDYVRVHQHDDKPERIIVFSFNYDTLFESALSHVISMPNLYATLDHYHYAPTEQNKEIPIFLFKPHGSWNWLLSLTQQQVKNYLEKSNPYLGALLYYADKVNKEVRGIKHSNSNPFAQPNKEDKFIEEAIRSILDFSYGDKKETEEIRKRINMHIGMNKGVYNTWTMWLALQVLIDKQGTTDTVKAALALMNGFPGAVESLSLSGDNNFPICNKSTILYSMPLMLIPYKQKDSFAMPYSHFIAMQEILKEHKDEIEEILIIGWKGTEENFLKMLYVTLGNRLTKIKITAIVKGDKTIRETIRSSYIKNNFYFDANNIMLWPDDLRSPSVGTFSDYMKFCMQEPDHPDNFFKR